MWPVSEINNLIIISILLLFVLNEFACMCIYECMYGLEQMFFFLFSSFSYPFFI